MKHETKEKLREFILGITKNRDRSAFGFSSLIFEEKYLDSLGFVMLLSKIEILRGSPINEEDLILENFSSINSIVTKYFE